MPTSATYATTTSRMACGVIADTNAGWVIAHYLGIVMCPLGLFGVTGIDARKWKRRLVG